MPSVSFSARIMAIAMAGFIIVWLAAVGLLTLNQDAGDGGVRPPPAQLAAIASLIEETPARQRPALLAALKSDALTAEVATAPLPDTAAPSLSLGKRSLAAYRAALKGRTLAIGLGEGRRLFPRVAAMFPNVLTFQIGLRNGEVLVVRTHSVVPVTLLGLPRGFGAGLLGAVIALAALYVMHRETRPLARLAKAVDRMDLTGAPVALSETDSSAPEIRALMTAFNRLHGRLSDLLKARMAMLGGISHDVRTFATRLRLRAELIPAGPDRARVEADVADMIRLLDDALLASRAGAGELSAELLDLADLVQQEVADRAALGESVAVQRAGSGGVLVLGDRLALRRIAGNLIDNALKYGTAAHASVTSLADHAVLIVDDDGPGIPPEQRDILLEPFVRLEGSRNRRTGGAGLGLSVVRSRAEAHGGSVRISDAPGRGARVTVLIPLFRDLSDMVDAGPSRSRSADARFGA